MNPRAFLLASKPNLSLPEEDYEEPPPSKLKQAMIAEGALIGNNLKLFFTGLGITGLVAADAASQNNPYEEWTLKAILIGAVLYLVREIAKRDAKIEKLYERLAEEEEEGNGGHPQRHKRK